MGLAIRHFRLRSGPQYEEGDDLVDVARLSVMEVTRDGHVRAVGMALWINDARRVAVFKPREACHLAQVLRIACAPGRNLAQARFNAKRSLKG